MRNVLTLHFFSPPLSQSVDVGSAGQYEVPQWKRELMENRARAKQLQEQRLT